MNGIDKIIEKILANAQADHDAAFQSVAAEADAIRASYQHRAEELKNKLYHEAHAQSLDHLRRVTSGAELTARKRLLQEKQTIIEDVFCQAVIDLCALPEDKMIPLLARLAVEAAETGQEELIFSAVDREKYGPAVVAEANRQLHLSGRRAQLRLAEQSGDFNGGLVVVNDNVDANCSFEVLVGAVRDELTKQVAACLFDPE